jgi:hypothetical protein
MGIPTGILSLDADSDRLVQASSLPQDVSSVDINAADDMLDARSNPVAQHFTTMITAADTAHRQHVIEQMQQAKLPTTQNQPTPAKQPPADYWFMQGPTPTTNKPGQAVFSDDPIIVPGSQSQASSNTTVVAAPTEDEQALIAKLKAENAASRMTAAYGHMKTLKTPDQLAAEARAAAAAAATAKPPVTPTDRAAIINLANNDDLDVATIARQAHAQVSDSNSDGEVVISLR